jgi:hypothetical protein
VMRLLRVSTTPLGGRRDSVLTPTEPRSVRPTVEKCINQMRSVLRLVVEENSCTSNGKKYVCGASYLGNTNIKIRETKFESKF